MTKSFVSTTEPQRWSTALRDRYQLLLSTDLTDWLDREIWHRKNGGEFDQPVELHSLLSEAPGFIWPGFMLPDSLPILGNRYGDWLCLRVGGDGSIDEVVHWYHGGGDWIPWGRTLAEAIAFDILRIRLPGRRQYYANVAAEFDQQLGQNSIPAWAAEHLPDAVGDLLQASDVATTEISGLSKLLIESNVAATAVHCECIMAALDSPLRKKLDASVARDLNIDWQQDATRWLFDNDLIPPTMLKRLADEFRCDDINELIGQDWETAIGHAQAVRAERQDLAWVNDILGWAAERSGRSDAAIEMYIEGLQCSSFADQSVRFRTHWYREAEGKFAAARLQQCSSELNETQQDDPYLRLFRESKQQSLRSRVTSHWLRIAQIAASDNRWSDAYDAYYRAGWDMGCDDLQVYRELLDKLADAADRSGQHARAELARTHLRCLVNRQRE